VFVHALGLVQVEVTEPEFGKGQHDGGFAVPALELDDGRVGAVWILPLR
jgi:hypothetical protein